MALQQIRPGDRQITHISERQRSARRRNSDAGEGPTTTAATQPERIRANPHLILVEQVQQQALLPHQRRYCSCPPGRQDSAFSAMRKRVPATPSSSIGSSSKQIPFQQAYLLQYVEQALAGLRRCGGRVRKEHWRAHARWRAALFAGKPPTCESPSTSAARSNPGCQPTATSAASTYHPSTYPSLNRRRY